MRRRLWLVIGITPVVAVAALLLSTGSAYAAGTVGTGTPASCDEAAFDAAFAGGGTITFNCGPAPATITFTSFKTLTADTTINGGGLITLSGGNVTAHFFTDGFDLTLNGLVLRDGENFTGGGAVNALNAIVAIIDSSLIDNHGESVGGAIAITATDGAEARLAIVGSTFDGNRANNPQGGPMAGGAISAGAGGGEAPCPPGPSEVHVLIVNSTFRDNEAGFGSALGQALSLGAADQECSAVAEAQILYSTFADHPGPDLILVEGDGASASLGASVLGPNISCQAAYVTSLGYNVTTDSDCFTAATGDQVVADSMIGPLASNGGPTQTMALLAGSPALDVIPAGTLECGAGLTEDQRGQTRPQGANCDAGAYEQVVLTDTALAAPTPGAGLAAVGFGILLVALFGVFRLAPLRRRT